MNIRKVTVEDAKELLEIYTPYVLDTAITFEYVVPSLEEFTNRIKTISAKYPYIVVEADDGELLGYAYASSFKGRKAYDWAVETTVYIKQDCRRGGLGKQIYEKLEDALKQMGILNMNACIAYPKDEDPYLTMDSIYFHEKLGFKTVGTFHDCGYKFNRWYHMIWMEKMIGEHQAKQPDVKFGEWSL